MSILSSNTMSCSTVSCLSQLCLKDYQQNHPEVTVLDPPGAIERIYNRQSMLQGMADLNLSDCSGNNPQKVHLTLKFKTFLSFPQSEFCFGKFL